MSDEVIDRLARIETKQDAIITAIEQMSHTVYGNGKPGVLEELAILRTKIEERTAPNPATVFGIGSAAAFLVTIAEGFIRDKLGQ